eukprot:TRINITY_DN11019_c0_g1_i1.p1 TRINITY_DN11019_c0_g1~~TRINITY_DN11019_c0_g1_i1.p1  ORF type:complete len:152 (+),score=22.57 TRINITY_DN11019_c0_g1_i1:75-530(+)
MSAIDGSPAPQQSFSFVSDLTPDQILQMHAIYSSSPEAWSNRDLAQTQRGMAQPHLLVALIDSTSSELLGWIKFTGNLQHDPLLEEIYLHERVRGQGYGRLLMESGLKHPTLASCQEIDLYCKTELEGFYSKFGFVTRRQANGRLAMRLTR